MSDTAKEKSERRRNFILESNLTKVIFVTAVPQVVTMLIDSLYNMADTYFVSQLGSAATAAVGVNDSLMMIIRAISLGFGMGASSYISRSLGAKKDEQASRAATTTLFTAMGVMVVLVALGSMFLSPIVNMLGATPTVKPYSMQYARWILFSAPITAATVCLSQTLRAEGSTTYSMIGSVSGCIINVGLDPLLINVLNMGVAGAAIATGISKLISACILFYPFLKRICVISIRPRFFTPTKAIYAEIARMGIPTMLRTSLMSVSTILINNVAAAFGDVAMAAISVANKSLRLVGSAVMGFGQGFQPIAGYSWGAKNYQRLRKAFLQTTLIGFIIGTMLGGALAIFAKQVIEIFSKDPDLLKIGMVLIRSQCYVLPLHVWVMIATGLFQALGRATSAGVMGLSRQLLSLIPSVLIMTYLFGLDGLALSQAVADVVSFCIALGLIIPLMRKLNAMCGEQAAKEKDVLARGVSTGD